MLWLCLIDSFLRPFGRFHFFWGGGNSLPTNKKKNSPQKKKPQMARQNYNKKFKPLTPARHNHSRGPCPPTLIVGIMRGLRKYIFQFELTYGLYMLEPWERAICCKRPPLATGFFFFWLGANEFSVCAPVLAGHLELGSWPSGGSTYRVPAAVWSGRKARPRTACFSISSPL